jgi:hypothetical protein
MSTTDPYKNHTTSDLVAAVANGNRSDTGFEERRRALAARDDAAAFILERYQGQFLQRLIDPASHFYGILRPHAVGELIQTYLRAPFTLDIKSQGETGTQAAYSAIHCDAPNHSFVFFASDMLKIARHHEAAHPTHSGYSVHVIEGLTGFMHRIANLYSPAPKLTYPVTDNHQDVVDAAMGRFQDGFRWYETSRTIAGMMVFMAEQDMLEEPILAQSFYNALVNLRNQPTARVDEKARQIVDVLFEHPRIRPIHTGTIRRNDFLNMLDAFDAARGEITYRVDEFGALLRKWTALETVSATAPLASHLSFNARVERTFAQHIDHLVANIFTHEAEPVRSAFRTQRDELAILAGHIRNNSPSGSDRTYLTERFIAAVTSKRPLDVPRLARILNQPQQ